MSKQSFLIIVLSILSLFACSGDRSLDQKKSQSHPPTILAAHYFSNAWPKTFWQELEMGRVDDELQQIKDDGFNTVILVIPWRGFELNFSSGSTDSNVSMYEKLEKLLNKITSRDLHFMLRLGFPHNFNPKIDSDILQSCMDLYTREKTQEQWRDFLQKISQTAKPYEAMNVGVLISWEDFWCPHFVFPHLDEIQRLMLAKEMGYQQWLKDKDMDLLRVLFSDNEFRFNNVLVPKKDDGHYLLYLQFIDQKLDQTILKPAKEIFANAAMEIRVDKDPAKGMKGDWIWVTHDLYFNESNHRGTYWAPFWGAENRGETLTLEQALFNFEYFLKWVTNNGTSTNHVIEQFNFTDNTPYFPNNANMNPSDVDEFLYASVPLLKKYSQGYGLWAYRDYADNALYNASFENGLEGWESDRAEVITEGLDQQLKLVANASIRQTFSPAERFMMPKSYSELNLCMDVSVSGSVVVKLNESVTEWNSLQTGLQCQEIGNPDLIQSPSIIFEIQAVRDIQLDEIKLYGFVQKLGVYDEFGSPGPYLQAIQKINQELSHVE